MPNHLVADYERAMRDPTLLSLRDEIALSEAMLTTLLQQLDDSPDNPAKDRRIFRQIMQQIDLQRRLVETEVRHIVLAREILTTEEAMTLMESVLAIVTRYIPDPKDRQAIADDMRALISTNNTETPLGAHSYA